MATVNDWQKYINLAHEHALVEDALREAAALPHLYDGVEDLAKHLWYKFFMEETA